MVLKIQFHLKDDQISWKLFHHVFEKDSLLEANLRKAPKITHKVLHPGNCKQNVPVALAIFHESTSVALTSNFPEKKKTRQRFRNFLINGGLFPILKFSFQTTFWAEQQKKMTANRNFVVYCHIGLKLGAMKGSHHLHNSLSSCQLPRL